MTEAEIQAFGRFMMGALRRIERERRADPKSMLHNIDISALIAEAVMKTLSDAIVGKAIADLIDKHLPGILKGRKG